MDELARWLGEQLDEDERAARAATPGPWRYNSDKHHRALGTSQFEEAVFAGPPGDAAVCVAATGPTDDRQSMGDAAHIAHHDPARVLREIEANRRRLDRHTPQMMVGYDSDEEDPSTYVLGCPVCQTTVVHEGDWPCDEIRDVVAAFVDRPGCREEWRP